MAKTVSRPRLTLADRLAAPVQRFLAIEAASTILLLLASAIALAWANSPWHESYESLWSSYVGVSAGGWVFQLSLEHVVNDGAMVLFFFVVGMEIKHELVHGELSSRERAMLPVFGALGGMIVPAGIYLLFHGSTSAVSGWGIPMATDIAFAVAALAALGPRVPAGLKVFLLALAIVDDLGAVMVIAIFYTHDLSLPALAAAAAALGLIYGMNRAGVRSYVAYWAVGMSVWAATYASGIHATIAGVLLGFLTPASRLDPADTLVARARRQAEELFGLLERGSAAEERGRVARELGGVARDVLSPLESLTSALHGWVAFVVMPIFAFANAGVRIEASVLADPLTWHVTLAVALGLLVGKPLGITLLSWLAVRLRLAVLPRGVGWSSILGASVLAGIGFTVALFITALAFEDAALVAAAKVGILGASIVAAFLGLALLTRSLPASEPRRADRR